MKLTSEDDHTDAILRCLEQAEVAYFTPNRTNISFSVDTTIRAESRRYNIVQLPKMEPTISLGKSRSFTLKRYYQSK